MAPKCYWGIGQTREKYFTLQYAIFLNCRPETVDPSVGSGRANFRPSRWYSSRCPTHTAFACMIREAVFSPSAAPMGALGISSETEADLGKERRTTTKAPPAEMLTAVANSRQSLPFASRVRIKTGMASCSRAHLRCSFFDKLRCTVLSGQSEVLALGRPHLMGQTSESAGMPDHHSKPRHWQAD